MKNLIFILFSLLIIGCASETEKKSLDEIADIYNAKTAYSKGVKSSMGEQTEKTFTITVSDSKLIDSLNPNVSSSNIGFLVYNSLSAEEKKNYTYINVNLLNLKRDSAKYSYTATSLAKLSPKAKTFNEVSEQLLLGNFKKLDEIKDAAAIPNEISETIKQKIAFLEQEYGDLESYTPFGIGEASDAIGTVYQFQAFLVFKEKKVPYIVVTDADPNNDKMIGFNIFN
ncbi:hypothetical protein [Constantimarinum furrinae]|uniref:Lipoprotein n=1 Tax=Constantimarinum furrinae TaxID=2562285 RepID=A0A7G8PUQ7_9FLAO|nr:hypothetical protein [Constantimarinum furrinae]QNJ98073.1 hypothetical protein ALE3EI_1515 [Constantimarinum furrinae]